MKCNHTLTDANNPIGNSWKHNCALCEIERLRLEVATLTEAIHLKSDALYAMHWIWGEGKNGETPKQQMEKWSATRELGEIMRLRRYLERISTAHYSAPEVLREMVKNSLDSKQWPSE